jgi:hypothetical protein
MMKKVRQSTCKMQIEIANLHSGTETPLQLKNCHTEESSMEVFFSGCLDTEYLAPVLAKRVLGGILRGC